jgi:hypothetical protein
MLTSKTAYTEQGVQVGDKLPREGPLESAHASRFGSVVLAATHCMLPVPTLGYSRFRALAKSLNSRFGEVGHS